MREAVVTSSARATLELIVGGGWLATLAALAVAAGAVARIWPKSAAPA